MIDPNAFTKMVPGFDFLQTLMQGAGHAAPAMGQWVAPTLNPEELEKRISELKMLQLWLEQNARMIGMTVQALEVQRMTLSTLQTMNLPLADLRSALSASATRAATPAAPVAPSPERASSLSRAADTPATPAAEPGANAGGATAKPAVDPMQWWGALTQQFTDIATKALQEGGSLAARNLAAKPAPPPAAAKKAGAARAPRKRKS